MRTIATTAVLGSILLSRAAFGGEAAQGAADGSGVRIAEVIAGSPAELSGLQKGDLLLAYNGVPLLSIEVLQALTQAEAPPHEARIRLLRLNEQKDIAVPGGRLGVQLEPRLPAGAGTPSEVLWEHMRQNVLSYLLGLVMWGLMLAGALRIYRSGSWWALRIQLPGAALGAGIGVLKISLFLTSPDAWQSFWVMDTLGAAGTLVFWAGYAAMAFRLHRLSSFMGKDVPRTA